MRTTIQVSEEQKQRLAELAAARGQRGCSKIVEEAVAFYLAELDRPKATTAAPLVAEVVDGAVRLDTPRPRQPGQVLFELVGAVCQLAAVGLDLAARSVMARVRA